MRPLDEDEYQAALSTRRQTGSFPTGSSASGATDDDETDAPGPSWPERPCGAFTGPIGRILDIVEPSTEADPVAVTVQLLAMLGNAAGPDPHVKVGEDRHGTNVNVLLIGRTATGRKGSSASLARKLMQDVDSSWVAGCLVSGLSSGEGLIHEVRDPMSEDDRPPTEKRRFIIEAEFGRTLRAMRREGNTLSHVIRQAFETGDLRVMTKTPLRATGAHISIAAHITPEELRSTLPRSEIEGGLLNRFIPVVVSRSKLLPEGGQIDWKRLRPLLRDVKGTIDGARQRGRVDRDEEARGLWTHVYPELADGQPGLLGAVTSRGAALVTRLSLLYALIEGSSLIRVDHLKAALALWDYAKASAAWVFGTMLGNPLAERLVAGIEAATDGLTRTRIRDLLGRHVRKDEIDQALRILVEAGRIKMVKHETKGRPIQVWTAVAATKATEATKGRLSSPMSLMSHTSPPPRPDLLTGSDIDEECTL